MKLASSLIAPSVSGLAVYYLPRPQVESLNPQLHPPLFFIHTETVLAALGDSVFRMACANPDCAHPDCAKYKGYHQAGKDRNTQNGSHGKKIPPLGNQNPRYARSKMPTTQGPASELSTEKLEDKGKSKQVFTEEEGLTDNPSSTSGGI